ncbi:MAG TPA: MFS transporter [Sporichthyaceae bacterium]|nr:MFS transporter [Sporichthyaceae bacterium]
MTTAAAGPTAYPATLRGVVDRDWRARFRLTVLVYCGLCTAIISSLGVLLIPTIAHAQHVSLSSAQWVLTVNLLVGAISTPVVGRLADGPRPRRVLIGMLIGVLAGSVLCAVPGSFPQLLVGRALQGLTYGIIPVTITLARRHLPAEQVRRGVGALSVTAATGIGLGYPFTGLIAEHLSYRVAFWVAALFSGSALTLAPLVIPGTAPAESVRRRRDLTGWLLRSAAFGSGAVVPGGLVAVPESPAPGPAGAARFDVVGTFLLALGLGAALLGLSETSDWGWVSAPVLGLLLGAAVVLTAWARWELHTPAPLVRLSLLRHPDVAVANLAALGLGTSMYIGFAAVGQLGQTPRSTGYGLGLSVFVAGCVIMPLSIGSQLASRVAAALAGRVGPRSLLPIGALFVVAANAELALRHGSLVELLVAMMLFGFGIGTTFAAMPGMILGAVPAAEVGSATSFNQVLRTIGGSIGSAITGAVLAMHTSGGLPVDSGYRNTFALSSAISGLLLLALLIERLRGRRENGRTG